MSLAQKLQFLQASHPLLHRIFLDNWNVPLQEYATGLFQHPAKKELEATLVDAFSKEWTEMGATPQFVETALRQLQQSPVLQTAHHITPTNGPTFSTIDLVTLNGLTQEQIYLVGGSSGVAFSNSAWSGALSYGDIPLSDLLRENTPAWFAALKSEKERKGHGEDDKRLSLIPARKRDSLLYSAKVEPTLIEVLDQLTPACRNLLAPCDKGKPYSHWAAKTCSKIQQRIFGRENSLYFDLNRVIARYLSVVFQTQPEHPCTRIFFDPELASRVKQAFDTPAMFLANRKGKKSDKVEPVFWKEGVLEHKDHRERLTPQKLSERLETGELCPAVFLTFFVLRFLNGIRCLGSFLQVEYLEDFRTKWKALQPDFPLFTEEDHALTTGRIVLPKGHIWPLDFALRNQQITTKDFANHPMSFFWEPLLNNSRLG